MKLDKAIEILELNVKEAGKKMPSDTLAALKLGIEAIKLRRDVVHSYPTLPWQKLPGED